jgi:hypothetical protein
MSDSAIEQGNRSLSSLMRREGDLDALAHALLEACFGGFPIENLSELLTSADPTLDKIGAWISSELGRKAQPIHTTVAKLLQSKSSYARFFALDTVLVCAGDSDGEMLAEAIKLVDDSESSVRWKAVQFLAAASPRQLDTAGNVLRTRGHTDMAYAVRELAAGSKGDHGIEDLLASESGTLRRIGLAGAVRRFREDDSTLKSAVLSNDIEIAETARQELQKLEKEKARLAQKERC